LKPIRLVAGIGTAPDRHLVSAFCEFLERRMFRGSARNTPNVFSLGYNLI
jgi:hypothetical protein